jgi:hypothetical protein
MKKNINEAYYNNRGFKPSKKTDGPKSRYIKPIVKRVTQGDDDNKKEFINVILRNIDESDAQQIKDTLIPSAIIGKHKTNIKGNFVDLPGISFVIPDVKFSKWIKMVLPKIETILNSSNVAKYPNASTLQTDLIEAVHNAPSEEAKKRAEQSLKEMEEAVYKAIRENRWDDAMVIYKKAINLMARVYGHQLSPNNVKSIYAQAEKAGIKPTDKGAATNSYWDDGTEKFWPTFVRSAYAWRKDFGRTIKDEPKMQYIMASGNRKEASGDEIQNRLKSQGFNSLADVSAQQKDRIKNAGLTGAFQGVGYDISDTEGPNDFFNAPGLLNNLDGTLTDSALADNEAWMKKLQDLKNQDSKVEISDKDRKRELASTEEGRAQIYLEGISKLCSDEWRNLNVTITQSDDKVLSYLYTIENVAKAKISDSGWKNLSNINKIAQMVTAAVALCTVGKNKIPQMGYNFKDVSTVFKSFEECKSTVLSVSDSILSALHRVTSEEDKQNAIAAINENKLHKFFNLMERMSNIHNENYNYELSEGIINRPNDDIIMDFLSKLGLNFEDNSTEMLS